MAAKEVKDTKAKQQPAKQSKKPKAEASEAPEQGSKPARPKANNAASARLRKKYFDETRPALMKELSLSNPMAAPRLEKVVVNMGVGEATQNAKVLDPAVAELAQITGQKPVVTRAKKSIAAFKVREGMPIGCMVTLRGDRMYEFLDRLMNVALPRVRDFRGVPAKSFDGRGNYTLGLRDQLIFPEIDYAKVEHQKGMNITIVTTATSDEHGRALLKGLGMPFRLPGSN
jgi:large subunit ribosomal protein L5